MKKKFYLKKKKSISLRFYLQPEKNQYRYFYLYKLILISKKHICFYITLKEKKKEKQNRV